MIEKTLESRDIYMYCDFHGHSRSRNAFIYGCSGDINKPQKFRDPNIGGIWGGKFKERLFPYLLGK